MAGTDPDSAIRRNGYIPLRRPVEPVGASSYENIDGAGLKTLAAYLMDRIKSSRQARADSAG